MTYCGPLFGTLLGEHIQAKTDQSTAKWAPSGQKHAFGPFCGVVTTKSWGWHREKVPSESRFGPSSPRYGQFSVLDHGAPSGPKLGQRTPFGSKNRFKKVQKATQTLPEWILPVNTTRHGSVGPLFWCLWAVLGPPWAHFSPFFGYQTVHLGGSLGPTGGENGPNRPQNKLKTHPQAPQVVRGHI